MFSISLDFVEDAKYLLVPHEANMSIVVTRKTYFIV